MVNLTSFMEPVQYHQYFVNTVDTDSLVLKHQDISSHSADNIAMSFLLFLGWVCTPIGCTTTMFTNLLM